jgi:hypothetical protein
VGSFGRLIGGSGAGVRSAGDREGEHPADPRCAHQQRAVRVVGVARFEAAVDLGDLALEVIDQLDR